LRFAFPINPSSIKAPRLTFIDISYWNSSQSPALRSDGFGSVCIPSHSFLLLPSLILKNNPQELLQEEVGIVTI
jgi:hypothetical protein